MALVRACGTKHITSHHHVQGMLVGLLQIWRSAWRKASLVLLLSFDNAAQAAQGQWLRPACTIIYTSPRHHKRRRPPHPHRTPNTQAHAHAHAHAHANVSNLHLHGQQKRRDQNPQARHDVGCGAEHAKAACLLDASVTLAHVHKIGRQDHRQCVCQEAAGGAQHSWSPGGFGARQGVGGMESGGREV